MQTPETTAPAQRPRATAHDIRAVALAVAALFLLVAIGVPRGTVPDPHDCRAWSTWAGPLGACARGYATFVVGWPAALLLPLWLAVGAVDALRAPAAGLRAWRRLLLLLIPVLPVAIAVATRPGVSVAAGSGLWGSVVAYYLVTTVGPAGAWGAIAVATSIATIVTHAWNPLRALAQLRGWRTTAVITTGDVPDGPEASPMTLMIRRGTEIVPMGLPGEQVVAGTGDEGGQPGECGHDPRGDDAPGSDERAVTGALARLRGIGGRRRRPPAAVHGAEAVVSLPPLDLLTSAAPVHAAGATDDEVERLGNKLVEALSIYGVAGRLTGATVGPVVTQFEVEPGPGVKVRKIATLADDLALHMRARAIRIQAPIPGRGAVGIEVPNVTRETVNFRAMLESPEFQRSTAALPIALGKDLAGRPVVADLAKMPHLLIAGATGSGKSVCVNTIITSLIYRHTPETLRLLMVDPKMVELSVYNGLPHLRHKVIVDNRDAAAVLKWAVLEMNERYGLLAANGCRNLEEFNRRVEQETPLQVPARPEVGLEDRVYRGGVLPYIVVVIDEMADLMMTVQSEVETPIAMLAQKARAIGIHLLLATQRPSVNVITGLIKANFPSRIAFRVASQVDSRTIIDGAGAEVLLGNGDMLFLPPGASEPSRLQGAFLASDETERVMAWYRAAADARRAETGAPGAGAEHDILAYVRQQERDDDAGVGAGEGRAELDPLLREAAAACVQAQSGSTSLLQRRLQVGYGRAARMVDQLEEVGVLGPANGPRGREVLVGLEALDHLLGGE